MAGKRKTKSLVSIGIVAMVLIGASSEAWSNEQILRVVARDPSAAIRLLTAPHTGKKICDLQSSTSIKFLTRANHGPHKFAKVEVLEGACVGKLGYVPWSSLDPEPRDN
jgi:hypothetical protein